MFSNADWVRACSAWKTKRQYFGQGRTLNIVFWRCPKKSLLFKRGIKPVQGIHTYIHTHTHTLHYITLNYITLHYIHAYIYIYVYMYIYININISMYTWIRIRTDWHFCCFVSTWGISPKQTMLLRNVRLGSKGFWGFQWVWNSETLTYIYIYIQYTMRGPPVINLFISHSN